MKPSAERESYSERNDRNAIASCGAEFSRDTFWFLRNRANLFCNRSKFRKQIKESLLRRSYDKSSIRIEKYIYKIRFFSDVD